MRSLFALLFSFCALASYTQTDKSKLSEELERYLQVLASDSLRGRGNFTIDLYKAAKFIAIEFEKDSLQFIPGSDSFILPFNPNGKLKEKWKDEKGNYDPEKVLFNVAGMIEGRSRPEELVIFCAHFDHMGAVKRKQGDGIYNGANDNASGTAAVLALAKQFSKEKNNERTLVFCAFGGEELGLLGSWHFQKYFKPSSIIAVINIEMIGAYPEGLKNKFFITGIEYSNLYEIINKNLTGATAEMISEPARSLYLFQRSDNLPFAMKGVPAHTIMSSLDSYSCYHKVCDEMNILDLEHMENIIEAIILSTRTIINGTETPSRIKKGVEPLN